MGRAVCSANRGGDPVCLFGLWSVTRLIVVGMDHRFREACSSWNKSRGGVWLRHPGLCRGYRVPVGSEGEHKELEYIFSGEGSIEVTAAVSPGFLVPSASPSKSFTSAKCEIAPDFHPHPRWIGKQNFPPLQKPRPSSILESHKR